jgi:hypothetical protein
MRKLPPGRQALLVLVHLRRNDTFSNLAASFGVGVATAHRRSTSSASGPSLLHAQTFLVAKVSGSTVERAEHLGPAPSSAESQLAAEAWRRLVGQACTAERDRRPWAPARTSRSGLERGTASATGRELRIPFRRCQHLVVNVRLA